MFRSYLLFRYLILLLAYFKSDCRAYTKHNLLGEERTQPRGYMLLKGQLEKREVRKFQVGKSEMKLERLKLESTGQNWNFKRNFPTLLGSFHLRSALSNVAWFFPT